MNIVFISFSSYLPVDLIKSSFQVSKFIEGAIGELPKYISLDSKFDIDKLMNYVHKDYIDSYGYYTNMRRISSKINSEYYKNAGTYGPEIFMTDFESSCGILDDHIVTINIGNNVLALICTEDDFNKIINEL